MRDLIAAMIVIVPASAGLAAEATHQLSFFSPVVSDASTSKFSRGGPNRRPFDEPGRLPSPVYGALVSIAPPRANNVILINRLMKLGMDRAARREMFDTGSLSPAATRWSLADSGLVVRGVNDDEGDWAQKNDGDARSYPLTASQQADLERRAAIYGGPRSHPIPPAELKRQAGDQE